MRLLSRKQGLVVCWVLLWLLLPAGRPASAAANTLATWNRIAEDTVVRAGAFQNEGLIYMAYVSAAVYDAVVAIEGGYTPYAGGVTAPAGASVDAAIVEAEDPAERRPQLVLLPVGPGVDGEEIRVRGELAAHV